MITATIITVSTLLLALLLMLAITITAKKIRRRKDDVNEELALKRIVTGICERLHAAYPNSKWRWVCRPAGFAVNGGIARIEVADSSGEQQFMDVCLSSGGYMAVHVLNVFELAELNVSTHIKADEHVADAEISAGTGPDTMLCDEVSITKWYNIVFIDVLTALIDDLNADGEVCVYIGLDGKAYTDKTCAATSDTQTQSISVVYDFGQMPDVNLWEYIIEKLGAAGLFAEVQDENCIFISWA